MDRGRKTQGPSRRAALAKDIRSADGLMAISKSWSGLLQPVSTIRMRPSSSFLVIKDVRGLCA